MYQEKNVPCNLCGADDYHVVFEANKAQIHRVVKCNNCHLLYANPQTDNVTGVEKIYSIAEEVNGIDDSLLDFNPENHQYLKKQYLQLRDYGKIIDFVDKADKGTFLEVGSYAGVFLNEAKKRGWEVIGIEPLEIPALYAEKKFGIKVLREYFEQADISEESLDAVVANHVIEHVSDPTAFVKKIFSSLKKGGNLILETPTYDSLMFKILKHRERSVRCEGHLFFFTKESLTKLVENNGFKVLKHEKVGRTLTMDRLFYNFGVITGKYDLFSNLSKRLKLENFVIRVNMRDMQRIYCVKE